MKIKKITTIIMVGLIIISQNVQGKTKTYTDVNSSQWFYNSVIKISNMGLIEGYPDKTFKPNQNMTVREFLVILSRYIETQKNNSVLRIKEEINTELTSMDWGYKEVQNVFKKIYKTKLNQFEISNLDRKITREEVVFLIANTLNYENDSLNQNIKDLRNAKYQSEIQIMLNIGVIQGYEDMTFRPRKQINRAEVVTIIDNLVKINQ